MFVEGTDSISIVYFYLCTQLVFWIVSLSGHQLRISSALGSKAAVSCTSAFLWRLLYIHTEISCYTFAYVMYHVENNKCIWNHKNDGAFLFSLSQKKQLQNVVQHLVQVLVSTFGLFGVSSALVSTWNSMVDFVTLPFVRFVPRFVGTFIIRIINDLFALCGMLVRDTKLAVLELLF